LALVEAAEINCEIMSWGTTLISAANLQLMLASLNCTYYEQAVPYEAYEYGMKTVIRTQPDGTVRAPEGPGLGVEIDWEAMEAATIHRFGSHG
jgi:L-alanine-DL-glutamate epimerase-like enolase superfamily enzyme